MPDHLHQIIVEPKAIKADPEAFSEFYDKYAPVLYGQILRIVHKKDLAEMLLQKVFRDIFVNYSVGESNQVNFFASLMNHTRKKANGTIKSLKMLEACSCE